MDCEGIKPSRNFYGVNRQIRFEHLSIKIVREGPMQGGGSDTIGRVHRQFQLPTSEAATERRADLLKTSRLTRG